jgi:hypothetical protein
VGVVDVVVDVLHMICSLTKRETRELRQGRDRGTEERKMGRNKDEGWRNGGKERGREGGGVGERGEGSHGLIWLGLSIDMS